MNRVRHVGKSWSASFMAGRSTRRVFRYVDKKTMEKVEGVGSFVGRLVDLSSGEHVGEIVVEWLISGDIEATFPPMEVGRYAIAIDHFGQNGEVSRFLDGFAGYLSPEYVIQEIIDGEDVIITVCCEDSTREVYALSGDAAKYTAEEAIKAAEEAKKSAERAAAAKNEALEALKAAKAFMESFNEALLDCIEVIDNYLYIGGVNTKHYLKGEDGITPHIGSDGYWYLGDKCLDVKAGGRDGITPHITADGFWAIGDKVTEVRAHGRDGLDGDKVRRIIVSSYSEIPQPDWDNFNPEDFRGVYYYIRMGDYFDVYAWLETADTGSWVKIGEVNDIATSILYGLVKLGTDIVVRGGCAVGVNGEGQLSVPKSDIAYPGVGKVGNLDLVKNDCAKVGLSSDGTYCVQAAAIDSLGVCKVSTSEELTLSNGGVIGFGSNKGLLARKATLHNFGTVKLGSQFGQSNPVPYLVGIGATEDGRLANNYAYGGALQHRKPNEWQGRMEWLDAAIAANESYFGDMYYSGLLTSRQFSQSSNKGLVLLSATETASLLEPLPGGVFIASGIDDEREDAVLTASAIKAYLEEVYCKKEESATRDVITEVVNDSLAPYAQISWVQNNFASKSSINEVTRGKMNSHPGVAESFYVIPASERDKIQELAPTDFYILYQD